MYRASRLVLAGVAALALVAGIDAGLCLAYAAYAAPAAPRSPAPPHEPRTLVVFGDSLAYGYMATPGAGWIDLVRTNLLARDPGSTVTNFAICGARARDVTNEIRRAPPIDADVVLLDAGANDVLLGIDPLSFAIDERRLLEATRLRYPRATIIVADIPDLSWRFFHLRSGAPPVRLPAPARAYLAALVDLDNAAIYRLAARDGDGVLGLHAFAAFSAIAPASKYISTDGLHPNDAGYAALARFAWPAVARALDVDS